MVADQIENYESQYDRWYKSLEPVVSRWQAVGFFEGVKSEYRRRVMATVLENQRLMNDHASHPDAWTLQQYKRLSIPVVRRVFGNSPFMDWVGVQPMLGPSCDVFMKDVNGTWDGDAKVAKTRFLKTEWPHELLNPDSDMESHTRIDLEAEVVDMLAHDLGDEISREIILDISRNCTVDTLNLVTTRGQAQALSNAFSYSAICVRDHIGKHQANWVVASSKMTDLLLSDPEYGLTPKEDLGRERRPAGVFYVGVLENEHSHLRVYCDSEMQDNKVLFGYRGNNQEAGYFYMPYVPLTRLSAHPVGDGTTRHPMMTRYGKFLKRAGSNYYRMVTINNVSFLKDEEPPAEAEEHSPPLFIDHVEEEPEHSRNSVLIEDEYHNDGIIV